MLLNNFFKIKKSEQIADNTLFSEIELNPEHQIFGGHFPGNPVVPGVVSVQMINEILSERLGEKLTLTHAKNIKFPAMINPNTNPLLHFQIEYSKPEETAYKVTARIYFDETVFLKFSGIFTKSSN